MSDVLRKAMTTYVNVGTTATPDWYLIGYRTEEASLELNTEIEKLTDILGNTITDVTKQEPQMSVEGFRVKTTDVLAEKLHDIYVKGELEKYSQFEVMNVFGWKETSGAFQAEVHKDCTIEVTSVGGATRVEMPFTLHFSNNKVLGTTNVIVGTTTTPIVFTAS